MRILWVVSSVGLGHLVRSQCIIRRLTASGDIRVDLLVPPPIMELADNRLNVLTQSSRIRGSGLAYRDAFRAVTDHRYDLIKFIKEDKKYNDNDYCVVEDLVKGGAYSAIVADEAFWLLSNNKMLLLEKRAPLVYITDFLGMFSMDEDPKKQKYFDLKNRQFALTAHKTALKILFIGTPDHVPDVPFGPGLPSQRIWAQRHCHFLKPIADICRDSLPTRERARAHLGIPQQGAVFLAVVGEFAEASGLRALIEEAFRGISAKDPSARFVMIGPAFATLTPLIQYHCGYTPNLIDYMAAADVVVCQSGYGKVTELSALGKPFIAFPLDYHFEQEFLMDIRIKSYRVGRQLLIRETTPESLCGSIEDILSRRAEISLVDYDDGTEAAHMIREILATAGGFRESG